MKLDFTMKLKKFELSIKEVLDKEAIEIDQIQEIEKEMNVQIDATNDWFMIKTRKITW